jgi:hypothetical protein
MFVSDRAGVAFQTPDPRARQKGLANSDAFCVGSNGDNLASDLVSRSHRQREPSGQGDLATAAEVMFAFAEVKVAVAHAGCDYAQYDFRARRHRAAALDFHQRRSKLDQLVGTHRFGMHHVENSSEL